MRQQQELNSGDTFNVPEGFCRRLSLAEILAATNDFSDSFVIGQGGFAKVYKGELDNGAHTVAIKKSKSMSPELRKEFVDEILMVSKFRHSHQVSLIGYCETDNDMILVYEYMAGGTLYDNLHKIARNGNNNVPLCWVERLKICIGAARGLDYLHTGTAINNKVIHRDVKSSNILLDENRATAKISDFGMSKIGPANQPDTCVITRVVGTFGYLDPNYYSTGSLTSKSDVYAFGVVLFEVLCGRPAVDLTLDEDQQGLAGWVRLCLKKGKVQQIMDPNLKLQLLPRSLSVYVKVAVRCLHARPKERPTMTEVLAELVLALSLQETGKGNGKKSAIAFHVGGSNIGEKLMLFLSVTPQPILGNFVSSVQLDELNEITENFGTRAFIGWGTFAHSYYGILKNGQGSCIQKFPSDAFPVQEFLTKVSLLSKLKHENVAQLLSYCVHGGVHILAYEYAPNGSLHDILHGSQGSKGIRDAQPSPILSWSQRVKIAVGASKGLEYLHENAQPNIIHGAIKSSNVLLFNDGVAKIVAPQAPLFHTIWPRRYNNYEAPGCYPTEQFRSESDIYSFGVVLLELFTGRSTFDDDAMPLGERSLVDWARRRSADKVKQCIDPRLNGEYPPREAAKMVAIALSCVKYKAALRPSISILVEELQNLLKAIPGPS